MTTVATQEKSDKYVLRFEKSGHRDSLKVQAVLGKRTLNKQILLLIEAGERAMAQAQQTQQAG